MKKFKTLIATLFLATCSLNANVVFAEEIITQEINAQLKKDINQISVDLSKELEKKLKLTIEKTLLKEEAKRNVESSNFALLSRINKEISE